ncbi:hypothetical protein EIP86_009253 [Pleurotus ostreatoroseus]|nr:hypothetical protein EIP86_009253 [Pleurotus ostreatoroseus]
MSSTDTIAIIGHSFRLPGGIDTSDDLWRALVDDSWSKCSTSAPPSRLSSAFEDKTFGEPGPRGGWLGRAGVEEFDPSFFRISPREAEALRPNTRLALELTWEALERAAIPPSSLAGKNVSVTIGMGNDDGWDLRQFAQRGPSAFDHYWGLDAEPSAVAGRVAQFFDFQGATSTISSACASGAAALDHGE